MKTVNGVGLLVIGLVVGLAVGAYVLYPLVTPNPAAGKNNQVQVSGTVNARNGTLLSFGNLNQTIETTANVTNGRYSVLLVGGQSYNVYLGGFPPPVDWQDPDYTPFYVPLGVSAFTENLAHI